MRFEVTREFGRPLEMVLEAFRDPNRFCQVMELYGVAAEIGTPPPNPQWHCAATWRGAVRPFVTSARETAPGAAMVFEITSDLATATVEFKFASTGETSTRVVASAMIRPKGMIAKMAVQSLRLMPGYVEDKLMNMTHAMGRPQV